MNSKLLQNNPHRFYKAVWRFHFYAGIYVIPFLVMLALTGLVMVLRNQIEEIQYQNKIFVESNDKAVAPSQQLHVVQMAYPNETVGLYIPPIAKNRSSQFSVTKNGEQKLTVFVNPHTGELLGSIDQSTTWYTIAHDIHGSFLLGNYGDYAIEIAAGFGVLLVITGLFMWWSQRKRQNFAKRSDRSRWRRLHYQAGSIIAIPLFFFLFSGLTWTGVWGSKLVQAWNSFPSNKWEMQSTVPTPHHATLNRASQKEVPWVLEQTPLPTSHMDHDSTNAGAVTLDSVVAYALHKGFTRYRVNLPTSPEGVYTISADTMSGDTENPFQDHTVHLDRYTGHELADIRFEDYPLLGKVMAVGVALHQGDAGIFNLIFNIVFCLTILFLAVSGVAMWWLRRPKGTVRIVAPATPDIPFWKSVTPVLLVLSLFFPLSAIAFVGVLMLDTFLFSRVPALKRFFN